MNEESFRHVGAEILAVDAGEVNKMKRGLQDRRHVRSCYQR